MKMNNYLYDIKLGVDIMETATVIYILDKLGYSTDI
jgi:hypothetical protein